MRDSKKLTIVGILVFFTFFFVSGFFTICFFSSSSLYGSGDSKIENENVKKYQLYQYNPQTDESSLDLITLRKDLGKQRFLSYEDSNGVLNLVSSIDRHKYKCSGLCLCENNRRTTGVISRGMVFLVASLSVASAYNIAKKDFHKHCEESFDQTCPMESLTTQVEQCERIDDTKYTDLPEPSSMKEMRHFSCSGNCLPKKFTLERTRTMANKFGCQKLTLDGRISLNIEEYVHKSQGNLNSYAKVEFKKQKLGPYCKRNSHDEYFQSYSRTYGGRDRVMRMPVNLCVGSNSGDNGSVKCRMVP